MPAISEYAGIEQLLDIKSRYEQLESEAQHERQEHQQRIEALEAQLAEYRLREEQLRQQRDDVARERDAMAGVAERTSTDYEQQRQQQLERIEKLEGLIEQQKSADTDRLKQIEILGRERSRIVQLVEEHCRDYEERITRLQDRLLARGIKPRDDSRDEAG